MNVSLQGQCLIAIILATTLVFSPATILQSILVPESVDAQNDISSSTTNTTSGKQNLPSTTDNETYIVTLKNQSSSDDLDDIIQSVEQRGANVTHVYSHSIIGFSVQIPSDERTETIDALVNDTRVNTIEPDQIMALSPPLE
ncbi:MAG: protease inhibitor I9 family protein [Nitrososphaeraceae archaeon]